MSGQVVESCTACLRVFSAFIRMSAAILRSASESMAGSFRLAGMEHSGVWPSRRGRCAASLPWPITTHRSVIARASGRSSDHCADCGYLDAPLARDMTADCGNWSGCMSEQSQSASMVVAGKIAVLALVIAAIGLPINDLTDYAILLAAAVVVFVGTVKPLPSRWLAAVALA